MKTQQVIVKEVLVMLYSLLDLHMVMMDLGNLIDLMKDLKLNGMMMMIDIKRTFFYYDTFM